MAERTIGKVTTASASGGAIGASLAQILVHLVPSLSPVETAITVILTAVLGLMGGYLVPPKEEHVPVEVLIDTDAVIEKINENPSAYLEPEPGNGKHVAED